MINTVYFRVKTGEMEKEIEAKTETVLQSKSQLRNFQEKSAKLRQRSQAAKLELKEAEFRVNELKNDLRELETAISARKGAENDEEKRNAKRNRIQELVAELASDENAFKVRVNHNNNLRNGIGEKEREVKEADNGIRDMKNNIRSKENMINR